MEKSCLHCHLKSYSSHCQCLADVVRAWATLFTLRMVLYCHPAVISAANSRHGLLSPVGKAGASRTCMYFGKASVARFTKRKLEISDPCTTQTSWKWEASRVRNLIKSILLKNSEERTELVRPTAWFFKPVGGQGTSEMRLHSLLSARFVTELKKPPGSDCDVSTVGERSASQRLFHTKSTNALLWSCYACYAFPILNDNPLVIPKRNPKMFPAPHPWAVGHLMTSRRLGEQSKQAWTTGSDISCGTKSLRSLFYFASKKKHDVSETLRVWPSKAARARYAESFRSHQKCCSFL